MCDSAAECSNSSLFRECYEENNFRAELNFCDCSSWFGWKGALCDERGPTVYLRTVVASLFILWNIFNFSILGNTLRHYTKCKLLRKESRFKKINPIFYVMTLSLTATICFIYVDFIRLLTTIDPLHFELAESTSFFSDDLLLEIVQKSNNIYFAMVILAIALQGIAFMVISLSWLDVLRQFNEIFDLNFCISESKLQKIIASTTIIFCISFLLSTALQAYTEFSVMFIVGTFLITVSYGVAYFRFRSSLKILQIENNDKTNKSILHLVRRSFQVTTGCFIGILVSNLIYIYGLNNFKEVILIGGFNYFMIVDLSGTAFGYVSMGYMTYYSFKITCNLVGKENKITWFPNLGAFRKRKKSLSQLNTRQSSQLSSLKGSKLSSSALSKK